MRRLFIVVSVLCALTATASAGELNSFYIGIKGGLNHYEILGDDLEDFEGYNYLNAYAFGAFFQYNIHRRLAIVPEVYYSVRGTRETGIPEGDIDWLLGYVDVPILFRILFPTQSTVTPNVYIGGYFSFLVSADNGTDVMDEFNSSDAGVVIGGGIDMMLRGGSQIVNLDVRLTHGLMKVLAADDVPDAYNNGFQFLIGWGFSL